MPPFFVSNTVINDHCRLILMSESSWINRIGNAVLDMVYPPCLYCISCGKIIDDTRTYRLCNECMAAMNWNTGRSCEKCGRPLAETDPGEICFRCSVREASEQPQSFDKGHACAGYGAVEQAVIFALKYGSRSDIGDTLGEIMFDYMTAKYGTDELAGMYDIVLPVPTHKQKKDKRGYNHADLMGQGFAGRAGIHYEPEAIIRTRATLPMKGLGPAQRAANIRGAFAIRERKLPLIAGARILLIDDIFTTGATIDEISALLKDPDKDSADYKPKHAARSAGASRVDFLAFAAAGDMIN